MREYGVTVCSEESGPQRRQTQVSEHERDEALAKITGEEA